MKELIKKVVETYGPAGSEAQIRELIRSEIAPYVDEMRVDALGNLIALKRGGGKKLMLAAHMDEIGIIVTHIDKNGFLRFFPVGGLSPLTLIGNRVMFENGTLGVVGAEKLEAQKDLSLNKLFIDIGAASKTEAEVKVGIGDVACMSREFVDLGTRLVAKAMDDRIACAILIEALKAVREPTYDIYAVFTTQEEVGLRGARVAAYDITPDLGIAIDVTRTGDTPESITMDVSLGKGPTVKIRDSSLLCTPSVRKFMEEVAQQNSIMYQLEVLEAGGTDAGAIQLTKGGIPAGVMSIPCRYIHTASEMVDYSDVQNGVKLLVGIMETEFKG
ncbi:MAG: putative aminopeptidase YsdC [Firmicutes bacterium]|nr:putative aminopeptidase YsdC [Bacillota bacterium]MBT9158049.1 putative aminopeptidase YsdC [Bacillota bacterium]